MTLDVPNLKEFNDRLRDEAAEEPTLEVPQGEPTKKTQIIAIYGKGGIGKSFTLANLSHMMAEQGKRVLLIGCDPKSDTTSLLFGGRACPTIIETSTKKKLAGEEVKIGDVCFKRGGVFAMELGGPEVKSLRGWVDVILDEVLRKKPVLNAPMFVGRMMAWSFDLLQTLTFGLAKNGLITRDQVKQLQIDNVVQDGAKMLADLGINATAPEAIIETYLWRYRPSGQYDAIRDSAKNLKI